MPELRKDPVTGRWVIIATERAKRPTDFVRDKVEIKGSGFCPFCYGNESKTPPEILAYRNDGSQRNAPGWSLRVVPNKFPALGIEGVLNRQAEGMFDKMMRVDKSKRLFLQEPYGREECIIRIGGTVIQCIERKVVRLDTFQDIGEMAGDDLVGRDIPFMALPFDSVDEIFIELPFPGDCQSEGFHQDCSCNGRLLRFIVPCSDISGTSGDVIGANVRAGIDPPARRAYR